MDGRHGWGAFGGFAPARGFGPRGPAATLVGRTETGAERLARAPGAFGFGALAADEPPAPPASTKGWWVALALVFLVVVSTWPDKRA